MLMNGQMRTIRVRIEGSSDSRGVLQLNIQPYHGSRNRDVDGSCISERLCDGGWDAVCDDDFNNIAAGLFCNTLGFDYGYAFSETHGDDYFAASEIDCKPTATDFSECTSTREPYAVYNCDDDETVGIQCQSTDPMFWGWPQLLLLLLSIIIPLSYVYVVVDMEHEVFTWSGCGCAVLCSVVCVFFLVYFMIQKANKREDLDGREYIGGVKVASPEASNASSASSQAMHVVPGVCLAVSMATQTLLLGWGGRHP